MNGYELIISPLSWRGVGGEALCSQIHHTQRHHCNGTHLPDGIAGEAHEQREYRTTEKTHNHQSRNLILLGFIGEQGLGEYKREDVRVAITHKCNGCIEYSLGSTKAESYHCKSHHNNTNDEEHTVAHHTQEERAGEAAYGTEDEIQGCGR